MSMNAINNFESSSTLARALRAGKEPSIEEALDLLAEVETFSVEEEGDDERRPPLDLGEDDVLLAGEEWTHEVHLSYIKIVGWEEYESTPPRLGPGWVILTRQEVARLRYFMEVDKMLRGMCPWATEKQIAQELGDLLEPPYPRLGDYQVQTMDPRFTGFDVEVRRWELGWPDSHPQKVAQYRAKKVRAKALEEAALKRADLREIMARILREHCPRSETAEYSLSNLMLRHQELEEEKFSIQDL